MYRLLLFTLGMLAGFAVFALNTHVREIGLRASTLLTAPTIALEVPEPPRDPSPTSTAKLRIPILIYHTIHPTRPSETESQKQFNVPPEVFEAQLRYLRDHGFTVISLDDLAAALRAGTTTAQKPVVITFDDGSHGQYEYAFPLLKKYGDTATFYIYTHPLDYHNDLFLSWDEVRTLADTGMTIGSHTMTHPYLSRLTPAELHDEIFESKRIIESEIGRPVRHFASPFGTTSAEVTALLEQAGYETGRSTLSGAYHSSADLLRLTGYFAPAEIGRFQWIVNDAIK